MYIYPYISFQNGCWPRHRHGQERKLLIFYGWQIAYVHRYWDTGFHSTSAMLPLEADQSDSYAKCLKFPTVIEYAIENNKKEGRHMYLMVLRAATVCLYVHRGNNK